MTEPTGKSTLREMAEMVGLKASTLKDERVTGFLAMRGAAYQGELMWVGRAVNGWMEGKTPTELANPVEVSRFVEKVALTVHSEGSSEENCKLRWVVDAWKAPKPAYNTAGSAFWRMAKKVITDIQLPDLDLDHWPSRLVWSNLYKISPEAGQNPSSSLAKIQLSYCRDILLQEVSAFRPKRLVFTTGLDWARDFLSLPCFASVKEVEGVPHVQSTGDIVVNSEKVGRFVVADHPMGKNETNWARGVHFALLS